MIDPTQQPQNHEWRVNEHRWGITGYSKYQCVNCGERSAIRHGRRTCSKAFYDQKAVDEWREALLTP